MNEWMNECYTFSAVVAMKQKFWAKISLFTSGHYV